MTFTEHAGALLISRANLVSLVLNLAHCLVTPCELRPVSVDIDDRTVVDRISSSRALRQRRPVRFDGNTDPVPVELLLDTRHHPGDSVLVDPVPLAHGSRGTGRPHRQEAEGEGGNRSSTDAPAYRQPTRTPAQLISVCPQGIAQFIKPRWRVVRVRTEHRDNALDSLHQGTAIGVSPLDRPKPRAERHR
jgi:hypothetical protein